MTTFAPPPVGPALARRLVERIEDRLRPDAPPAPDQPPEDWAGAVPGVPEPPD